VVISVLSFNGQQPPYRIPQPQNYASWRFLTVSRALCHPTRGLERVARMLHRHVQGECAPSAAIGIAHDSGSGKAEERDAKFGP
jgi:hypothetical protein